MDTVIVTGASGLLGHVVASTLSKRFRVLGTYFKHPEPAKSIDPVGIDLTNDSAVNSLVSEVQPAVIVHCAAMTNVDDCEVSPSLAFSTNVTATELLVLRASQIGARFVYISTDSVFDGTKSYYTENDDPAPVNYYAKTKLLSEEVIQRYTSNHLILRGSFFGLKHDHIDRKGLLGWILGKAQEQEPIPGFVDVFFNPVSSIDFARIIDTMLYGDSKGIYHIGGQERLSKFEFALEACRAFGYDASLVRRVSLNEGTLKAQRPKDTSLNASRLSEAIGREMPEVAAGLQLVRNNPVQRVCP